jgi:hypothetical protein
MRRIGSVGSIYLSAVTAVQLGVIATIAVTKPLTVATVCVYVAWGHLHDEH